MTSGLKLVDQYVSRHRNDFVEVETLGDHPLLVRFLREQFGARSRQQDDAVSNWQYSLRPGSRLFYCRKDGRVVGVQGAIGFELRCDERRFNAAWAVGLRVDEEWKLKGLGVALIGELLQNYDVVVGLGISDEATRMFRRQGWLDVGPLQSFSKPLRAAGLLSARHVVLSQMLRPLGPTVDWGLRAFDALRLRRDHARSGRRARIVEIDRFSDRHVAELEAAAGTDGIRVGRSARYLNWRFFDVPCGHPYRVLGVTVDGRLRGFVATAWGLRNGKHVVTLSEIDCARTERDRLLWQVVREARKSGADAVFYQGLDPSLRYELHDHGFIERPDGSRFMVYSRDDQVRRLLGDRSRWHVGLADSDLEHPMLFMGAQGPSTLDEHPQRCNVERFAER